jgi:hypothetical protein
VKYAERVKKKAKMEETFKPVHDAEKKKRYIAKGKAENRLRKKALG